VTLTPAVALAVLTAAIVHATWNALAHGIKDQLVAFGLIGAGGAIGAIPLIAFSRLPAPASRPYLIASVVVHVFYCLFLMRTYKYGDFGQVYPIARGTSPLVVTVLSAVFVGERPSPAGLAGIVIVSAGLATLAFGGIREAARREAGGGAASGGAARRSAIAAAVATGLTIAGYTVIDGVGVRASRSPAGYTGWLMLLQSADILLIAVVVRRRAFVRQPRGLLTRGTLAGLLSVAAYGLVLWAQTRGALAPIAALRETSVIFGAIIGTAFFHEPFGRTRVLAALTVAAGIILLAA
jgi:drug/metabolite transporter (DMT)-like permease